MVNAKTVIGSAGLVFLSAGAGFGVAYFLQKKRYEKIIDKEIDEFKEEYPKLAQKTGIWESPITAAEALNIPSEKTAEGLNDEDVEGLGAVVAGRSKVQALLNDEEYYKNNADFAPSREAQPRNVDKSQFTPYHTISGSSNAEADSVTVDAKNMINQAIAQATDVANALAEESVEDSTSTSLWDNDEALAQYEQDAADTMPKSNPDKPYIITYDQFMTEDQHKDNKLSVVYYEEDGQLVDEKEQLINDIENMVGEDNLDHFGLGSQDKHTVYIRNEKLDIDFEVVRDKRSFSEVVLGVKPSRENQRPLRMRDDDQ